VEDVKNMSRLCINKLKKNLFDQDALELFLNDENKIHYFLRKFESESQSKLKQDCGEAIVKQRAEPELNYCDESIECNR
jgi:hypothetical protein